MPHHMTNRGLFTVANTAITASTDVRCAVFKGSTPTAAAIRDMNFLSDLTAVMTEAAAAGYARVAVTGETITENDSPDTVTFVTAAPSWASVAVGETWTALAWYIEGASDAARVLLSVDIPSSTLVTNGGPVTGPALTYTIAGS